MDSLTDRAALERLDAQGVRQRLDLLRRLEGSTTAAIAAAVAVLDRTGGVASDGAPSTAEWLKTHTGRTGRDAARMARLADNLDQLPATAGALADGRLGAAAADSIVRATRDPRLGPPDQVEADLLALAATHPPQQLDRAIRRRQHQAEGAALLRDERRQHARRRATLSHSRHDGMWDLHARLPNETGTALRTLLDAFDHPDGADTPTLRRRRPDQRLADALEAATHAMLDGGLAPGRGGVVRPHLSIVVDVDTWSADLARGDARGPHDPDAATTPDHAMWALLAPGETDWGGVLSPQAVRRLSCDAAVRRIMMAGSQVLDVGRATRDWSSAQRRAVNARDRGCRGPACTRPLAWTHIHHVRWWSQHGTTAVENGIALCHHCHRLVHDHGWILDFDPTTAAASWTSPHGVTTTTHPPQHSPAHHDTRGPRHARRDTDETPRTRSADRRRP